MEQKSNLFFIGTGDEPPTTRSFSRDDDDATNCFRASTNKKKKNKPTGVMHLIRVALYMITNKSSKKKSSGTNNGGAAAKWKKLLGLVRPLHLETRQLPAPPALRRIQAPAEGNREVAPPSPAAMSQYASADSLLDLDEEKEEEEEKDENYYDGIEGDDMIDSKAEEFIARFYRQMRLQDQHPTTSHGAS